MSDVKAMSKFVITAKAYAALHAMSERQILKLITTGSLSDDQHQGAWYVRVDSGHNTENLPHGPMSVQEYAKYTGVPISRILEEVATGSRSGFHHHGIWYVGIPPSKSRSSISWRGICLALLLSSVLALAAIGSWFWYQARQPVPALASLHINIVVMDKAGKSRPVVREAFFLLTKDLDNIADNYISNLAITDKVPHTNALTEAPKWVSMLAGSTALRSLLFDVASGSNLVNIWEFRQNFEKSKILWAPYTIQSTITNNAGQAQFNSIPAIKDYWVMGWTETNGGIGFWERKTTLTPGENKLTLNTDNAMYFK